MEPTPSPKRRPAARIGDGSRNVRKGFASMDKELQRQIASAGGKASHAAGGKGHRWTPEQAREAGCKGGQVSRRGKAKPQE